MGTLWGLLVLSLAYLHHSTSGFALPALLPIISEDLHLTDTQGALLTAGYTVGRAGGWGEGRCPDRPAVLVWCGV
jgi:predicted MFS family arabinose efflux permease